VLPDPLPSLAKRGDLPKTFARWGQRAGDMRGGGGSGHVILNQHFAINTPDANSLKRHRTRDGGPQSARPTMSPAEQAALLATLRS
jgi:hypothetical protein